MCRDPPRRASKGGMGMERVGYGEGGVWRGWEGLEEMEDDRRGGGEVNPIEEEWVG